MNSNEETIATTMSLASARRASALVVALRDRVPAIVVTGPRGLVPRAGTQAVSR